MRRDQEEKEGTEELDRTGGGERKSARAPSSFSTGRLTAIALSVVLNYVGAQLALLFRLPIYLDNIGTIFAASLAGPGVGMLVPAVSCLLMGLTGDIFSIYFAPASILVGLIAGLLARRPARYSARIFLDALAVALPGTVYISVLNAAVFGGVTSSGSSLLVQLLRLTSLSLTQSIFLVQIITDYADRLLSLFLVRTVLKIPAVRRLSGSLSR